MSVSPGYECILFILQHFHDGAPNARFQDPYPALPEGVAMHSTPKPARTPPNEVSSPPGIIEVSDFK